MNININERPSLPVSDFEFLSSFKDKNEYVFFKLIKETDKKIISSSSCKLTLNDEDEYPLLQRFFRKYQKEGFGVFFVVNNGGYKSEKIKRVSAHFLDMDFAKVPLIKDGQVVKNGTEIIFEYRTNEEIEIYKREFLSKLCNFKMLPSIICETKNGFHVYWLLDRSKPQILELFTPMQEILINYFGNLEPRKEHADLSAKTLQRLLRVINYNHLKDPNNPFMIKCIYFNPSIRYTQEEIATGLNVDISILKTNICSEETKNYRTSKKINTLTNSSIKKYNNQVLTKIDYKDVFEFLRKEIDLRDFLGINFELSQEFSCVFHNDKHPSANISQATDGSYRYFCHSSSCDCHSDKGLDIVDLVERKNKCSTEEALKYLTEHYNLEIVDEEWINHESIKYQNNLAILSEMKDYKYKYPSVYRLLRYAYPVTYGLLAIGKDNIVNRFFQVEGNGVFFVSNRFLSKQIGKNLTRTNQYINLLCTLGLIVKVADHKIPVNLLKRSKELAKQKGQYHISFYTIPNFEAVLNTAEEKARVMIECNFSINSMSKKYIENIFGTDFANSIYYVSVKETESRKQLREDLESIAINYIKSYGYTTKEMVLNNNIFNNGELIDYSIKKYELNRILPDILQKYGLSYIKANKVINDKLKIDTRKYLIIRDNLLI